MLQLSARVELLAGAPGTAKSIFRVVDETEPPSDRDALLVRHGRIPRGHAAYLIPEALRPEIGPLPGGSNVVVLPAALDHVRVGDVVRLDFEKGRVRILYRRKSSQNNFLVTERCDHYCLMCSQPPKDIDDGWLIDEILEAIPLINSDVRELGFTGGEPTLLGEKFLAVLRKCKECLPTTALHVLSNGRRFADEAFAKKWANLAHHDLMVGIPIYSDTSERHNYVVQAAGAFDETIRGILNLKRLGQKVEIRVVLHKATYERLPRLAEFISRNLLFVDQVALMGLEIMGFTRANLDKLWIDPIEYQPQLREAVAVLSSSGMRVSIYNLQLCLLDRSLWPFSVQSISDWKREYFPQCDKCVVREKCGGMFFSAKFKSSDNIRPILAATA